MELVSKSKEALGSVIEIKLPKAHSSLFPFCFSEVQRIESAYSRFKPDSELSNLNQKLGVWQLASEELIYLITRAEEFSKKTQGNFDITLKSTLDSLGYDETYSFKLKKPNPEISANLLRSIQIDPKSLKILLNKEIEFGGFGKGFAQDRVAALLEKNGCDHYYINAGGDIFAKKGKEGGDWMIILEHPDDPTKAIGTIKLDGKSLAASAPNRRKWGEYHHLINAKTKLPANEVKAIFVIANTGLEADAYATALFTAGFEEGIRISKKLPVDILAISNQNKMFVSDGFNADIFH
jgi:FAD:protein FMN transferase